MVTQKITNNNNSDNYFKNNIRLRSLEEAQNSSQSKYINLEKYIVSEKESSFITWAKKTACAVKNTFLLIGEIFANLVVLAYRKLTALFIHKKSPEPANYLFAQQYNNACHEVPIYNYHVLQNLKGKKGSIDLDKFNNFDGKPLTRRQWYGKNNKWLYDNLRLINEISNKDKYPHLANYLERGLKSPIFPSCSFKKGAAQILGFLEKFNTGSFFYINPDALANLDLSLGCFKVDSIDARDDAYLSIPIIEDKEGIKIFNTITNEYESINDKPWIRIEKTSTENFEKARRVYIDYNIVNSNPEYLQIYPIPKEGSIILFDDEDPSRFAGFKNMAFIENLDQLITVDNQEYFLYLKAIYRLMIFSLGIDHDNNAITPEHENYKAYCEIQEALKKFPADLWNREYFNKDMFGNYQIAKILKNNKVLKLLGDKLVDTVVYKPIEGLERAESRVDQKDKLDFKKMMGSKEQLISHSITKNIRTLLYGAINPASIVASLELDDTISSIIPARSIYTLIKDNAYRKHDIQVDGKIYHLSFIDYWKLILQELKKCGHQDFVMFDDHGWVLSLDEDVITKQNRNSNFKDKQLVKDTGIAMIESWHGKHFDIWYKK